jgi:hypothetical protein
MDIPLDQFITTNLYEILKYFNMQFVALDLKFNVTRATLKIMEIAEIKVKETIE